MNHDPSRAEVIFLAAAEIAEPKERAAFLDQECGDDLALRGRVEALLASHNEAGDFLDVPAPSPEMEAKFARLKPEEVGERIGPYRLMEQIGQGGFGTVWVADQEKPVRRRVALKIIKMGMPSVTQVTINSRDYPAIRFRRLTGASPGAIYTILESTNLSQWQSVNLSTCQVGNPMNNGDGTETIIVRSTMPMNGAVSPGKAFLRAEVTSD